MVSPMPPPDLLLTYDTVAPHLNVLGSEVRSWLVEQTAHLGVQVVEMRVKRRESLERKLARPDRVYERLDAVKDVLGLRVITLFEDQVDEVASLIQREFEIDWTHSVDKRALQEPSHFGYRSLHYVIRAPEMGEVPEWVRGWPVEIQLRSVLQHAWAEVEHDLGYQTAAQVPVPVRRRFARLAGLLELADAEFLALRKDMQRYEVELRSVQALASETVGLDARSLQAVVDLHSVYELDRALAQRLELPLSEVPYYPEFLIKLLPAAGLSRPGRVIEQLATFGDTMSAFAPAYFRFVREHTGFDVRTLPSLQRGYCLHLLAHWEAATGPATREARLERLTEVFLASDHRGDPAAARASAQVLLEAVGGGR